MKKHTGRKVMAVLLGIALLAGSFGFASQETVEAGQRTLLLAQAKSLALANSSSYRRIKSKIALKEVSYKQAVKSLQLKKKNMATFRWTPLLSFKFPEKPHLDDESEYVYKPAQIQSEINGLKHKLTDDIYSTYEKVSNLYTEIYGYQEKITFKEARLTELQSTLNKNKTRLAIGAAKKSDIEAIEKSIRKLESEIAKDKKKFETKKSELSDQINLDVTTRYRFVNPYVEANIPRTSLNDLVAYTLDRDQAYYEAKLSTQVALLSLDTNSSLMRGHYGGKMDMISSFVQQVKDGEKLDSDAFKKKYDEFLEAIDAPWQGKLRILFIKIPKVWFKGAVDGVRYVEDEPYALYEAALEYQEKLADQNEIKKDLEKQVRDTYETLISSRTSYLDLKEQVTVEKKELEKSRLLNSLGECTFEEYSEALKQYEELQMDELEALQLYTTQLYSYDRLTCGAVTRYLKDKGIDLEGGKGGQSYVVDDETEEGARYYIHSIIDENMFEFGVYIPDGFETEITHFELWCDNQLIGTRTELDKTVKHLLLSLDTLDRVFVRFYNEDEFVDDCEIDAQVYEGPLTILKGYLIKKAEEERQIGTYSSREVDGTPMVEIALTFESSEQVGHYVIQNGEGKYILKEEPVPCTEPFQYLGFLADEMEGLVLKCYDAEKNFLYDAWFTASDSGIWTKEEETE